MEASWAPRFLNILFNFHWVLIFTLKRELGETGDSTQTVNIHLSAIVNSQKPKTQFQLVWLGLGGGGV